MSIPYVLSNSAGGMGGSLGSKLCPDGEYIKRLYGYTSDHLDQVCGECSDGSSLGCYGTKRGASVPFDFDYGKLEDNNYNFLSHIPVYADDYVNHLEKAGTKTGTSQLISCPANMHFAGLHVRSGDWVDNLGFACRYNGMAKYTMPTPYQTGGGLQLPPPIIDTMPDIVVPPRSVSTPVSSVAPQPPVWVNNDSDVVSKKIAYISSSDGYISNGFSDGSTLACEPPVGGYVKCDYYDSKGLFDRTFKYVDGQQPKFKIYIPPITPVDVVPTVNTPVTSVVPYTTNTNTVPAVNIPPENIVTPPALTPTMPVVVNNTWTTPVAVSLPGVDKPFVNPGPVANISIETIKAKKPTKFYSEGPIDTVTFEDGTVLALVTMGDTVKCTYFDSTGITLSNYTFAKGSEPRFNQKKSGGNTFLYILILIVVLICAGAVFSRGPPHRDTSS